MAADPDPLANPLLQLTLEDLRRRTSIKWTVHPPDVIPLWVAEMDVLLAAPVAAVLQRAVADGDTGYPGASHAYAEALASFARRRWEWSGLEPQRTALVADVMTGVVEVLKLITDPGDAVVVCAPVYPPFYAFVSHAGRRVLEAELTAEGRIDPDALDDALRRARAVGGRPVLLLSNPHNPTGVVHTRHELEQIAAVARRHGARVISDEIHAPLMLPGATFVPYLSVKGAEDAFALFSASKGWNLAGVKAALLVAGEEAARDLQRLPEEVSHGPSHLGVLAHTAAFELGGPWLDALLLGLERNRSLLAELVDAHLAPATMLRPEAGYLGWLDCRHLELHDPVAGSTPGAAGELAGPARFFLEQARVALSSGHVFGAGGAGFVRLNFATHPDILRTALDRMGAAVAGRG